MRPWERMFYTNTCSPVKGSETPRRNRTTHARQGVPRAAPRPRRRGPHPHAAAGNAGVAALQVGLHARGLYKGPIDGITGPATAKAIRRLQARARIAVDGVVGPQTRRALGRFARHRLGS